MSKLILVLLVSIVALSGAPFTMPDGWWSGFTFATTDVLSKHQFWAMDNNGHRTEGTENTYGYWISGGQRASFHPGLPETCDVVIDSGCRIGFNEPSIADGEGAYTTFTGPWNGLGWIGMHGVWNNNPSGGVGITGGKARSSFDLPQWLSSDGHKTHFFPMIKYDFDGMTTKYFVSYPGPYAGAESTEFTVYEKYLDGTTKSATYELDKWDIGAFDALNNTCDGCIGSAKIISDEPIITWVVELEHDVSPGTKAAAYRGVFDNIGYSFTVLQLSEDVYTPIMKNDFYGSDTEAFVYNSHSNWIEVGVDFNVTGAKSGCSNQRGDTASDMINVPPMSMAIVSHEEGNVGGLDDCVFYTAHFHVDGWSPESPPDSSDLIAVVVRESKNGGNQIAAYNGASHDRILAHGDMGVFPTFKEDFNGNRGSITIMSIGRKGHYDLIFTNSDGEEWNVRTTELDHGEAVSIHSISKGEPANGLWTGGWGYGEGPDDGAMYNVEVRTESGTSYGAVAVYQEAHTSGLLDVNNVEMFFNSR